MNKILCALVALIISVTAFAGGNPKREFRGAWLNTIYRSEYHDKTTAQCQAYLRAQLEALREAGVNAVLFQVRPQADAFYDSKYEPWSRFLTDGGKKPVPYWDPLQFMIDEAHALGMELHAWLNPYRVTSSAKQLLPAGHIYHKHPERFIRYEGKLYFDPALPENRDFIVKVVDDIVSRYDIDGIHFDDYFYPYPGKTPFPDDASYKKYGKGKSRSDWRRDNVDKLIEAVSASVKSRKAWVRFGVSPFGIWRNKTSDPKGSDTSGLENYDALYADVLLWARNGWVDYLIPQLYWEIEHPRAGYSTLVEWWAENIDGCHLYIGQDVNKCMDKPAPDGKKSHQLHHKLDHTRRLDAISGVCWWPGYSLTSDYKGAASNLKSNHHSTVALPPAYGNLCNVAPEAPKGVTVKGNRLEWSPNKQRGEVGDVVRYVVYYFAKNQPIDIDKPEAIISVQPGTAIDITRPGTYAVTALDRVNNESKPSVVQKSR